MTSSASWPDRLRNTAIILHITAFVVAVTAVVAAEGLTTSATWACLLASIGVVSSLLVTVPMRLDDARSWLGLVVGVALFSTAMGLTGGIVSPFAIMPVASIFLAAAAGGIRVAVAITAIALAGLVAATLAADVTTDAGAIARYPAIYVITAIAFSEVRRALLTESERADDLTLATHAASSRRERLEETHVLLEDLLRIATSPDINAVATAQGAIRDIGVILPDASIRIRSTEGVTLARRGDERSEPPSELIAIAPSDTPLAHLELWVGDSDITPRQRNAIESTVSSVGLALENDAMVQRLAGLTIQRERVRLARELHDDIAPSIASVGLALDMVLLGADLEPDQHATLDATRSNVTRLVERIRNRVQDLRADRTVSIVELAHSLVADVDADGPTVLVDIDERIPPRPAVAVEVGALVSEAFRNALSHAGASVVTVEGRIDDGSGRLVVRDNGRGFDAADQPDRHFGLIGMQERAELIGATLDIDTTPGAGTTVTVSWEDLT